MPPSTGFWYKPVMRLSDRVIVVTGASGIAASAARLFAAEGASVFIVAIEEAQCAALAESLSVAVGAETAYAVADLTVEPDAESAFAECVSRFGRIDGLLAAAGSSGRRYGDGTTAEIPKSGWEQTVEANLVPPFLAARQAVRVMAPEYGGNGGSIVLLGSVLASHPSELFQTHAYAAAKGGIVALSRAMASAHASDGIRVNVLAPGLVRTPMSERAANDPETVAYSLVKQPLAGGFLEPDDVARAALFLLSDDSSRITGQVIAVDGGWSVTEART